MANKDHGVVGAIAGLTARLHSKDKKGLNLLSITKKLAKHRAKAAEKEEVGEKEDKFETKAQERAEEKDEK